MIKNNQTENRMLNDSLEYIFRRMRELELEENTKVEFFSLN